VKISNQRRVHEARVLYDLSLQRRATLNGVKSALSSRRPPTKSEQWVKNARISNFVGGSHASKALAEPAKLGELICYRAAD
jgi:hypothetical protein